MQGSALSAVLERQRSSGVTQGMYFVIYKMKFALCDLHVTFDILFSEVNETLRGSTANIGLRPGSRNGKPSVSAGGDRPSTRSGAKNSSSVSIFSLLWYS